MADRELEQLVERLLTLVPYSPDFLAARDRLALIATAASERLGASVLALAAAGQDGGAQAAIARRLTELQRLHKALMQSALEQRGWRAWFRRAAPDTTASRTADTTHFVALINDLAASRDELLRQSVVLDRARAAIGQAADALERACAWLSAAEQRLDAQCAGDNPRAQALRGEILPVLRERKAALATELALATQAQLALSAVEQNSAALSSAIAQAAKAAQVASLARRTDAAASRISASEAELAYLVTAIEGVAAAGEQRNPNLIDQAAMPGQAQTLAHIGQALAGVRESLGDLDAQRDQLARTTEQIAQCQLPATY